MYHKKATKTSWIWEWDSENLNRTILFGHIIFNFMYVLLLKIMRNCVYTHFSGGQISSATKAFSRFELESEWIEVWLAVNYSLSWSLMSSTPAAVNQVSIETSLTKTLSPAPLPQPYPSPIPPPNLDKPSLRDIWKEPSMPKNMQATAGSNDCDDKKPRILVLFTSSLIVRESWSLPSSRGNSWGFWSSSAWLRFEKCPNW